MYKNIESYLARGVYPFHMPGHKRNAAFLPNDLLRLDMTEIPGMDVLSSPTGFIKALQNDIATFYGADESLFLVNGSSAGVVAAVCYAAAVADKLIIPRNAHASMYNGLALSDILPEYILPEITSDGLAGGICPDIFEQLPQRSAVLVVSPTYEGFVSDIAAIAEKVHAQNGLLIVDEAHGAHFAFHDGFPSTALENGADIVINSFHKTLPALSQTAVLHVKKDRVDIERLKFFVNAMQTSSPSYIFMTATDYMLRMLWERPAFFDEYFARLVEIRASLAAYGLSGKEQIGKDAVFDMDIGKLLFSVDNAEKTAEILAEKYFVQMEMAAQRHMLAMTSVADTNEGFQRLEDAIKATCAAIRMDDVKYHSFVAPEIILSPYEALRTPSKSILWEEAVGKISAQLVVDYPPGIAIVAPGERIPVHFHQVPKKSPYIRVVDQ